MNEREISWAQYDADVEDGMNGTESSLSSNSSCSDLSTNWIQSSQRILEDFRRIKQRNQRYHNHDDFFHSSTNSSSSSSSTSSDSSLTSKSQCINTDISTQLGLLDDIHSPADQQDLPGQPSLDDSDTQVGRPPIHFHPFQPRSCTISSSLLTSNSFHTTEFLKAVIKQCTAPVVCRYEESKGKAIVAEKFIPGASRLWTEHPLVAIQHSSNKTQLDCCDYCFLPLCGEYRKMWAELCEAWKQIQVTTFLKEKELNEPILTDDLELVLDRYGIQKQNCGLMGPACSCVCGESYCSKHCRDKALEEYHILLCPRILPHEMDQLNALMRQRVPLSNLNANNLAEEYSPTAVLHAYVNLNDDYSLIVKLVARIVCDFIRTGNLDSGLAVDGFHQRSMSGVLLKLEGRFQSISTPTNASAYNVLLEMHQSFVEAVRWSLQLLEETNKLKSKNAEETFKMCSQVFSFEFFIALFESIGMNTISMEIDHPFLALIDILDPHELAMSFSASQGQSAINSDENLLRVRNVLKVLPCLKQHQESVTQLQGITGSAFYSLICTLNRSCEPNVTVLYTKNCDAHVVAIRDVAEGEELCIADVDVDLDVNARDIVLHECDPKSGCTCVHAGQMVVV
ncbi:unnamed protein product [Albugo candida]|uniref:SET domain-containing protein n=1 Tax=Albugo candida TaxID=65357 RepID=A0A024GST4_9STRA|nr:unnamed protein product [Albugo candida]|eukprot:CCI49851.1 unnamed protein product [Albugo candida]